MEVLGVPDKEIVACGSRKNLFFGKSCHTNRRGLTPHFMPDWCSSPGCQFAGEKTSRWHEENFIDFIAKCLHWDPERRLKPQNALRHPFVTAGRRRPLPVTPMPASSSRSLLASSSSCVKASILETPKKGKLGHHAARCTCLWQSLSSRSLCSRNANQFHREYACSLQFNVTICSSSVFVPYGRKFRYLLSSFVPHPRERLCGDWISTHFVSFF